MIMICCNDTCEECGAVLMIGPPETFSVDMEISPRGETFAKYRNQGEAGMTLIVSEGGAS